MSETIRIIYQTESCYIENSETNKEGIALDESFKLFAGLLKSAGYNSHAILSYFSDKAIEDIWGM
jgi:hypothetical protein